MRQNILYMTRYRIIIHVGVTFQISDPIFKLARFLALWEARGNHAGAGRGVLAALGWPISHHLADAEFVVWHSLDSRTPRRR
jgi:hypothetical protein